MSNEFKTVEKQLKLIKSHENIPLSDEEKKQMIDKATFAYEGFLDSLRIDWRNDPNAQDTPRRVAKAWVNDLIRGCYSEAPKITAFDNIEKYDGMVFQGEIPLISMCSHHNLGFTGFAHVAYIPSKEGKVIGLSKLNRIVDHFARRPQVQENLTQQIHDYINKVCKGNLGVAVMISANHTCCSNRGIGHNSTMKTSKLSGTFMDNNDKSRDEFYQFISDLRK